MVSAYLIPNDRQLVVVAVNYGNMEKLIRLDIPGLHIEKIIPYTTSDGPGENLLPGKSLKIPYGRDIPSRSIVTFVCTYN
jgi:hypothetical protein